MIKYLMRKTTYKKFDKESQDMLFQLNSRQAIIEKLCFAFCKIAYIFPFIPLFIIYACEDIEFSIITKIAIITFGLIWFVGLLVFNKIFKIALNVFSELLEKRIYFLLCTTKGKAICKKDLKIIKQVNEKLYEIIENRMCRGYCYSFCFFICKVLKKGSLEFIAIKRFTPYSDKESDGKDYTMHVLYVNNGWAFDAFSSRQYPIEKLHEIYKAKIYRTFSFEEISSKSYEEFIEEQDSELTKWATDNNCFTFSDSR